MSAPPEHQADRVTIPVKLRPKLAAFVRSLGEPLGLTDRQVIAMLIEDLAMRGAEAHAKRHVIVVRRAASRSAPSPRGQPMTPPDSACGNPKHKGHKRYVGGCMDGQVSHLIYADPSDYPQAFGTVLRDGTRSWYEIDYEASDGTEVVYRFIGTGRDFPARTIGGSCDEVA